MRPRERAALEYADSLKQKFAHHPQIKRIARHRQVPRHIFHEQQQLRASKQKISRKYVLFFLFYYCIQKANSTITQTIRTCTGRQIDEHIRNLVLYHMFLQDEKLSSMKPLSFFGVFFFKSCFFPLFLEV